ncbi:MAG: hypothetical protein U9Q96_01535 [Patescibacteria group bacterium]|nr:hypothetical protein [Patescibacteria group bacterium]
MLNKIPRDFLLPSAAFTVGRGAVKFWKPMGKRNPKIGDLVFGKVIKVGQHKSLEHKSGRIHSIHSGTKLVTVFGNRYAPDYYEGIIPKGKVEEIDLLARSGVIGLVSSKSAKVIDPTRIKIFGYVCNKEGKIINSRSRSLITPKKIIKKYPRAKMILVCGTSMNSGKSTAAFAVCRTLKMYGYSIRATKATGTASLKDILGMNDAGAKFFADFSFFGFPSTYLLPKKDLLYIFNNLDLKYANNPKNYWVVEFADGINQRETVILLESKDVRERIHKFIFCASDAFSAIGGLKMLKERFNLKPDAISGICSSSPLHIREIEESIDIPIFNSANPKINSLIKLLE